MIKVPKGGVHIIQAEKELAYHGLRFEKYKLANYLQNSNWSMSLPSVEWELIRENHKSLI